jgi:hydroxyacylglutathione hydrolase
MIIHPFPSGPYLTNCYVIGCPVTKIAAIVDPSPGSLEKVKAFIAREGLLPEKILLTHSHWDHIAEAAACKELYELSVHVHELDRPNLEAPGSDSLPFWIDIPAVSPDTVFDEGDVITIGTLSFTVIHTPGHSGGSVCFYSEGQKALLSGDTLFKGTIGNISFPTSRPDQMWPSLAKLSKLPPETIVYPGHGPKTTIGAEKWLPEAKKLFGAK